MNKKILIGSIIAVVILVLVSFTGVVGFQSVKLNSGINSPLFDIRSNRALDKESKDLTYDYVGKGEEGVLSIPKRDDKATLNQKVLKMIYEMDDITFNKFMNLVVHEIQQRAELKDVNIDEVITAIHQLRDKPGRINLNIYKNVNTTWRDEFVPTLCWFPGCGIFEIVFVLVTTIIINITLVITWVTFWMGLYLTVICPEPTWHIACASWDCK